MLSNIRVTYSGLISMGISMISVITGIAFSLVITRQLTPEEFGIWGLIGNLVTYVGIFEIMVSYWVTRQVARGTESGRTALLSCGIFTTVAVSAYVIIIFLTSNEVNANINIFIFSIILIPALFFNNILLAINFGWKPQFASYGVLVLHTTKIPLIILTVYFLDMGVYGIIISVVFGYVFASIALAYFAKEKLRKSFQINYLKQWIKLSWLPSYLTFGNFIARLDLLIFSIITGSVVGLAYYGAAFIIAGIVRHSAMGYQAIYPKLLEGGAKDHLKESTIRFFYFGFPLSAISIVFAKPALYALNPLYVIAVPVVILLSIREFLMLTNGILDSALQGIDKIDTQKEPSFRHFLKSKLFFLPTLKLIRYSSYIVLLVIVLSIFKNQNVEQIDLVIYWAAISAIIEIPFVIHLYFVSRKHFDLNLPFIPITKYALTSGLVFLLVYVIMDKFLKYDTEIFNFLPNLLSYMFIGVMLYLGITYVIDARIKVLFNAIFLEINNRRKHRS